MMISPIIAVAFLLAGSAYDEPAAPLRRTAPDYPVKCVKSDERPARRQEVVVVYDVTSDGLPENVRVRTSTDPCFEDVAIAAIRGATFSPRRSNGKTVKQEDLETTFTFVLEAPAGETLVSDFDARPVKRIPPRYPERCMSGARSTEVVVVEFDVNEAGKTENVTVIDSTNRCLETSAKTSVAGWIYTPKTVGGVPVRRTGVQTAITFQLSGGGVSPSPEDDVRRTVWFKLSRIRSALLKERAPATILEDLAALETEYGDKFTRAETTAFLQLRGGAKIMAGDYAGALDDLRVAIRGPINDAETRSAIEKTIGQLEAALGVPPAPTPPAEADEEIPKTE